jgi:hypothetical protein
LGSVRNPEITYALLFRSHLGAFVEKRLVFDVALVIPVSEIVVSMYVVSQSGGSVEILMMVCWKIYPPEIYFFEVSIKNV